MSAWIVLPAFVSFYIAQRVMLNQYPPVYMAPRPPEWLLLWRNFSLCIALLSGLIGLPRWQAILGLLATVLFLFLVGRY
jgi:hypothetical protein